MNILRSHVGMRACCRILELDHKTKDTRANCIPIDVGIVWGRAGSGLKQGRGKIGAWFGSRVGAGLGQGWGNVFVYIGGGDWW